MNLRRLAAAPALVALAAGLILASGCNKKPNVPIVAANQPPTVRITSAPLDTTQRNYYVITINWIGFDPDGRVDHFLYALDPPRDPGSDTAWVTTTDNTLTHSYPCPLPDRRDTTGTRSSDFHVFVIKAVDNLGAMSPPVARAFWSYTIAPTVHVDIPPANSLIRYYVPPAVILSWEGTDVDGVFSQKPVKYKFTMLTNTTAVSLTTARSDPDSVRRYFAPKQWAGWDSTSGDTTSKQYTNLTPDQEYMFVVVAFDEAGAYSPIFSLNENMIYLRVTFAGSQNPVITLFNEFFLFTYPQGSFRPNDPSQIIQLEVPASNGPNDKLTFNWLALPASTGGANPHPIGGPIRSYRWAVDITDLSDETPRTDEDTDLAHWSTKDFNTTSCRIGPYAGNQTHKFYLEAEDVDGLVSLGTVQFNTVQATFSKPLLVVNDTRFIVDSRSPGTTCDAPANEPVGLWPSAAELDTFLFAVGGQVWKCYPPVGSVFSTPGLFHGYQFDTVGTRLGINDLTVRLKTLGTYQHVIWLVDGVGALNTKPGTNVRDCTPSMRYMNANGRANTVAAYVHQGGLVWLAGGGAVTASLIEFNKNTNDTTQPNPRTLTFSNAIGELVPGRFIYDQGHWQSEIKQYRVNGGKLKRYLGRWENPANPAVEDNLQSTYHNLPVTIDLKSAATDPFPPNRGGSPPSNFYQTQFDIEFLSAANLIIQDLGTPTHEDFESTLDTLYKVTAPAVLQPDTGRAGLQSVVMTRYHGPDNTDFLVSGFNFWSFKRANCQALLDYVLQTLWGLPPPSASMSAPARASFVRPGPVRVAVPTVRPPAAALRQIQVRPAPATHGTRD